MQFARPEAHKIPFGFPTCVDNEPFTLVYNTSQLAEWKASASSEKVDHYMGVKPKAKPERKQMSLSNDDSK